MLFEKNTLFGLLVLWFTGCSAVSPGHWPFCARASSSVPGAPASSLVTGSHVLVLNPGVEICAPVWVATALLCTFQPAPPRLVMSLAPVSAGELRPTAAAGAGAGGGRPLGAEGGACRGALCPRHQPHQRCHRHDGGGPAGRTGTNGLSHSGHSCPAVVTANDGRPRWSVANAQLVRNLSKQTCQEAGRTPTPQSQPGPFRTLPTPP